MNPYRDLPKNTRCLPASTKACAGPSLPKNTRRNDGSIWSERGTWTGLFGVIAIPVISLFVASCAGWFTPARTARIEQAGIDAVVCVLEHENESPASILAACSGVVVEDVTRIVLAHKAAMAKASASAAPACSTEQKLVAPQVKP